MSSFAWIGYKFTAGLVELSFIKEQVKLSNNEKMCKHVESYSDQYIHCPECGHKNRSKETVIVSRDEKKFKMVNDEYDEWVLETENGVTVGLLGEYVYISHRDYQDEGPNRSISIPPASIVNDLKQIVTDLGVYREPVPEPMFFH